MTTVTIVLPNGNQQEAGRLGNGIMGGSTLLVRPIVFGSPDELDTVFVIKQHVWGLWEDKCSMRSVNLNVFVKASGRI
ncbi:MAG: hypothetical protein E4G94_00190 [ANME-2 cluster archaeon]|nr:MAG: hypothetical protein E4G94_00190 [ANME-2 cluster archaeon]